MPSFPLPLCIGAPPPSPSPPLLPHQLHPRYSVQFLNKEEKRKRKKEHLMKVKKNV